MLKTEYPTRSGSMTIVMVGLLQGLALFALYKTYDEHLWPREYAPLFNMLLVLALFLPFAFYWSRALLSRRQTTLLILALGGLMSGLAMYQAFTVSPPMQTQRLPIVDFPIFPSLILLTFASIPLLSGWTRSGATALGRWNYSLLFDHSWRNAVVTAQAGVLTGMTWAVLVVGAQLFRLIGIDLPSEIIEKPWFVIPVTTFSFALGLRAGFKRHEFTVTLRNHWLTLTAWLLPLVALIGSVFVLMSLGGVEDLFENGLSAVVLLWFCAFWVKFYNSAFQDGSHEPPFGHALKLGLRYTAPGLLVIAGLALWALIIRINQYGLTPERIWGLLVALVAVCYGVGYSLSLFRSTRWMATIPHANVFAILVALSGVMLFLSPLLDPRKLSVASQLQRLENGKIAPEKFDFSALGTFGSYGDEALKKLAQTNKSTPRGADIASRAQRELDYWRTHSTAEAIMGDDAPRAVVADVASRIDTYPKNLPLPVEFLDYLKSSVLKPEPWAYVYQCLAARGAGERCIALQVDLNHDGQTEIVLWADPSEQLPNVFTKKTNGWLRVGYLQRTHAVGEDFDLKQVLEGSQFKAEPPKWDGLTLDRGRFFVYDMQEQNENPGR